MTPSREAVTTEAARLERIGWHASAQMLRDLLRELETTAAALALLTARFGELARERDELLLQLYDRRCGAKGAGR